MKSCLMGFYLLLTCFGDVERQPEEESIADQLSKQQTQRELHHSLQTNKRTQ